MRTVCFGLDFINGLTNIMELFYTTSAGFNQLQVEPIKSTGGFKSSTTPKNDDFDNLFGEVACYSINQNRDEYLALMLVNTTGATATNVQLWLVPPVDPEVPYSNIQVAAVLPANDSEGNPKIERTRDRYARPFIGTFADATEASRLVIGDLAVGESLGLWFRRILLIDNINEDQSNIYEREPNVNTIYTAIPLSQSDTFNLNIQFNE